MSMWKLALSNFKSSFKNYLSLIVSLAFTIGIFYNFQNIVASGIFDQLGKSNASNIEIVIQMITFVLCCFMFFFIWYATNVFLERRKKEIGIYIFMGLNNQKIGKLYLIEILMIGLTSLIFGIGFGIISSQLFQMIISKLSDISVNITLTFSLSSVLLTSIVYAIIYAIFSVKGYINIVRSSVLEMVSATKRNEYVKQNKFILFIKAILGVIVLGAGYYLAIQKGGLEVMSNGLAAVVLVTVGVYLLFGGIIPVIFQTLAKNKRFLYHKERNLWINNIIFRMKKNYRTYAIVTVLMLCSVTALATGFAMKNRYDNIITFRETYTYQILNDKPDLLDTFADIVEKDSDIAYQSETPVLYINPDDMNTRFTSTTYAIVPYSKIKQVAKDTNLEFDLDEPQNDEYIDIDKLILMSLITDSSNDTIQIKDKTYHFNNRSSVPYLGYFQESAEYYMVSDSEYERLKSLGQEVYLYNFKTTNLEHFDETAQALMNHPDKQGLVKLNGEYTEIDWIKILFSVCVFMFMVFVLASGSILFMKLYNDSFEDHDRYFILQKLGISKNVIRKSISKEVMITFLLPFIVMSISSYFSVKAVGNVMFTDLLSINIVSIGIIAVLFIISYLLSVMVYVKNTNIQH